MTFSCDVKSKYSKGTVLKKISTMDRFISIETVDKGAIEHVNVSILLSAKQNSVRNKMTVLSSIRAGKT